MLYSKQEEMPDEQSGTRIKQPVKILYSSIWSAFGTWFVQEFGKRNETQPVDQTFPRSSPTW